MQDQEPCREKSEVSPDLFTTSCLASNVQLLRHLKLLHQLIKFLTVEIVQLRQFDHRRHDDQLTGAVQDAGANDAKKLPLKSKRAATRTHEQNRNLLDCYFQVT